MAIDLEYRAFGGCLGMDSGSRKFNSLSHSDITVVVLVDVLGSMQKWSPYDGEFAETFSNCR